jgi:predicted transposase YbfD/YdcC
MVSVWSATNRAVLGQVKTDDKSIGERSIPQLLELLDVEGALVAVDAAGTQTAIAEKIFPKAATICLR